MMPYHWSDRFGCKRVCWAIAIALVLAGCSTRSSSESEWQAYIHEGSRAYHQGQYARAEALLNRALDLAEHFNQPDARLAESLYNLAEVYRAQGEFGKAEPLYWRSLPITAETVGPEHPDMASGITGLALLYQAQGRFQEAEPLFNRALAINEKSLGEDHPQVAKSLARYASLLVEMGRQAEASHMQARARSIEARSVESPEGF